MADMHHLDPGRRHRRRDGRLYRRADHSLTASPSWWTNRATVPGADVGDLTADLSFPDAPGHLGYARSKEGGATGASLELGLVGGPPGWIVPHAYV